MAVEFHPSLPFCDGLSQSSQSDHLKSGNRKQLEYPASTSTSSRIVLYDHYQVTHPQQI